VQELFFYLFVLIYLLELRRRLLAQRWTISPQAMRSPDAPDGSLT
jgi:hypothetical protein